MAEPLTPLEARKALKLLTDVVAQLERQVADITVKEREAAAAREGLLARVEEQRRRLSTVERCCDEQTQKVNELEPRARELARLLAEETARANAADDNSVAVSAKSAAFDHLVGLCLNLVDAFDRLPMKPEDWHVIPSDVQQEIALYGTYEWNALADAKLALEGMVKKQTP